MENNNHVALLKAKKRVKQIKEFYSHLFTYILVNSILITLNLFNSKGGYWFIYPLLGWGIGLFSHAANTFHVIPFLGKNWEDRKIQQFMDEERNKFRQ